MGLLEKLDEIEREADAVIACYDPEKSDALIAQLGPIMNGNSVADNIVALLTALGVVLRRHPDGRGGAAVVAILYMRMQGCVREVASEDERSGALHS
jgi:hypothetical protein